MKRNNDKELKIIKDFITKTNNGKINESNAATEFKKLKQKINNDKLKYDKMRYSLEPHYRRYVQGQGFMSFARNIGNKYGRKIFDKSLDVGNSMKKNMVEKY